MEDGHWWFTSRRDAILRLTSNLPKESGILDLGCSGGILLQKLKEKGFSDLYGIDISKKAVELCRERKVKNVFLMDGPNLKLEKKFDLIVASDVLEHIKDENRAISSWKNSLKENGRIICFVPAF